MSHEPDRPCRHENFAADVAVNRIGEDDPGNTTGLPNHYSADIRVRCADCGEPFRWIGVPAGLSPAEPRSSADETELRAPLCPVSSSADFGLDAPGFTITRALQDNP
jgi:hypothetical protein